MIHHKNLRNIQKLELKRFILVGHSFGGAIIIKYNALFNFQGKKIFNRFNVKKYASYISMVPLMRWDGGIFTYFFLQGHGK